MSVADPIDDKHRSLSFRILDSQEVDLGTRSIIYNRVETPVLKPQPPVPENTEAPDNVPSADEIAAIREWEVKHHRMLVLSCTVYDHAATLIRWQRPDGEYVFWSSIDFNHLRGLQGFESGNDHYTILMGIGNESTADVLRWNAEVDADAELHSQEPDLRYPLPPSGISKAAGTHSVYQVVDSPKAGLDPQVITSLDALHAYHVTNKDKLAREFEQSEAERIIREQWVRENPPQSKDSVIQFFPIRSNHSPTEARVLDSVGSISDSHQ